ncbi:MAG TPA: hypothetical protein VMF50_11215 [Candidatus Binataceae bacterium]|nr:hypothetical protein [Candidatus Binataceae bacterium]
MEQVCFALPIVSGKTDDARTFLRALDGPRKAEFDRSERRIGIVKESWFLQHLERFDVLIGYMESSNFSESLLQFARSRDDFDLWFKSQMLEITGVDLNNPPPGPLSEQLSRYEA